MRYKTTKALNNSGLLPYINISLKYLLLIIGLACSAPRDKSVPTIYSKSIKDSFELYIHTPSNYSEKGNYSVIFYLDANLKMGKELRRQIKLQENQEKLKNTIFIGIGHIGDYRELRRRDFIPPLVQNKDTIFDEDVNFGRADKFYQFLSQELIPYISQKYPNNRKYTLIGHSFGGLFVFYCLMKPNAIFQNYIALSPSLWVNDDNFFEIERNYQQLNLKPEGTLFHSCGSWEWINKVLYSSRRMKDTLLKRNYQKLKYHYIEYKGEGHNGTVPVSLQDIFKKIDL
jgi:hypothetical protein